MVSHLMHSDSMTFIFHKVLGMNDCAIQAIWQSPQGLERKVRLVVTEYSNAPISLMLRAQPLLYQTAGHKVFHEA